MTRRYARAKKDQRAVDSTPLNTPATTTILSSIRLDGSCIYTTYQGGTTAERFESYLKSDLLPTLGPDDIVVMDNMRSHHAKVVKNLLDEKHIQYLYLPPYSPDYNPIENMWSKIKANMRKQKVRTAALLKPSGKLFLLSAHRIVWDGFVRVVMCNNLLDCYKITEIYG